MDDLLGGEITFLEYIEGMLRGDCHVMGGGYTGTSLDLQGPDGRGTRGRLGLGWTQCAFFEGGTASSTREE